LLVRSWLKLLWVGALQVSAGCGPTKTDGADAGGRDFGLGDLRELGELGDGPSARPLCEELQELPFNPVPVDVMLVFDRSESMSVAFGDGTRHGALADLLRGLVPAYEDRIRFGFQVFPSRGGCPAGYVRGCCAEPPSVGIDLGNAPAVLAAVEQTAPVEGNTPTAEALRLARRYFNTLNDGVNNRYVLLATDGKPSCNGQGQLDDPRALPTGGALGAACADALAEAEALLSQDVKVIVLGIGAELAGGADEGAACLEQLARRGGAARLDGPPAYHTAEHPEALERTLRAIFGATVSRPCLIELTRTPADRAGVRVLFDGQEVPRNRVNGWDFEGPSDPSERASRRLVLFGEACQRVDRFQVTQVQVQYGCPCENELACE
jgi:hypothetical protein